VLLANILRNNNNCYDDDYDDYDDDEIMNKPSTYSLRSLILLTANLTDSANSLAHTTY